MPLIIVPPIGYSLSCSDLVALQLCYPAVVMISTMVLTVAKPLKIPVPGLLHVPISDKKNSTRATVFR